MSAAEALDRFRAQPSPTEGSATNPFKLMSTLDAPAAAAEVEEAWPSGVPAEVADLWSASREGRLWEDVEYGQWGLSFLSPSASAQRTGLERSARPSDVRPDDVVIGEFLGDQELLVFAPSESGLRRVLVALPLDERSDWFGAAGDLGEFLDLYFESAGDKFWERL